VLLRYFDIIKMKIILALFLAAFIAVASAHTIFMQLGVEGTTYREPSNSYEETDS
jgi:hypothetical protein